MQYILIKKNGETLELSLKVLQNKNFFLELEGFGIFQWKGLKVFLVICNFQPLFRPLPREKLPCVTIDH